MNAPRGLAAFWVGLLALLIVAGGLRLWSYDFSLPLVDHQDEPLFYQQARVWRGLADLRGYLDNYPPVFITLNLLTQSALEAVDQPGIAATVRALRLLSVMANLFTLVCIAQTARLAAGNSAGWAAGAAWGLVPLVLENGVYATPDPLVYAGVALALWLGAVAWTDPARRRWCLWSFAAGLLAVLTKYPVLSALLPGLLVALWVFFKEDRRRGLRYLLIMGVLLLALVAFLLWAYPVVNVQREGEIARTQGLANLLDAGRVVNNLYHAILPLQPVAFLLILGLGMAAYTLARRLKRPQVKWQPVMLAALLLLTLPWLAAAFSVMRVDFRMKDVLPGTVAACVLLGIGMAQVVRLFPQPITRTGISLVLALSFVPPLIQSMALAQERHLPDSRVILRQWAANLEPGGVLLDESTRLTFNSEIGGIPGSPAFTWLVWDGANLEDVPLHTWRLEHHLSYAIISQARWQALKTTVAGRAYLANLLPLRAFVSIDWRGPQFRFYRLWRMEYAADVEFAEGVHLVGYDLSTAQVAPGETLHLRFYWHAAVASPADMLLHVWLEALDGQVLASVETAPGPRPTSTWTIPDETLIGPGVLLSVPQNTTPGDYRLQIRLGAGTAYTLMQIPVMAVP